MKYDRLPSYERKCYFQATRGETVNSVSRIPGKINELPWLIDSPLSRTCSPCLELGWLTRKPPVLSKSSQIQLFFW